MDGVPMLDKRIAMRRPPCGTLINAICVSSNDPLGMYSHSFHGGTQNPAASKWDLRFGMVLTFRHAERSKIIVTLRHHAKCF
jgi:hypothetical protein